MTSGWMLSSLLISVDSKFQVSKDYIIWTTKKVCRCGILLLLNDLFIDLIYVCWNI